MFPVNLYLSYVFSPSKEPIIIILIWQNYMPEIKN